jgi:hypothetical protein
MPICPGVRLVSWCLKTALAWLERVRGCSTVALPSSNNCRFWSKFWVPRPSVMLAMVRLRCRSVLACGSCHGVSRPHWHGVRLERVRGCSTVALPSSTGHGVRFDEFLDEFVHVELLALPRLLVSRTILVWQDYVSDLAWG